MLGWTLNSGKGKLVLSILEWEIFTFCSVNASYKFKNRSITHVWSSMVILDFPLDFALFSLALHRGGSFLCLVCPGFQHQEWQQPVNIQCLAWQLHSSANGEEQLSFSSCLWRTDTVHILRWIAVKKLHRQALFCPPEMDFCAGILCLNITLQRGLLNLSGLLFFFNVVMQLNGGK